MNWNNPGEGVAPSLHLGVLVIEKGVFESPSTIVANLRGSLNKFPDFFHMGTFIASTHMKL